MKTLGLPSPDAQRQGSIMDVVVNFTPAGMIPTKEMTPHVPIDANEIIAGVRGAVEIGISMVHLHARSPDTGEPTYSPDIYGEFIEGIRTFTPITPTRVKASWRS